MRKGRNGSVAQCKSATQKRRFVRWVRYCLVGCASQPPFQRKSSSFPGPSSARFGRSPHVHSTSVFLFPTRDDRPHDPQKTEALPCALVVRASDDTARANGGGGGGGRDGVVSRDTSLRLSVRPVPIKLAHAAHTLTLHSRDGGRFSRHDWLTLTRVRARKARTRCGGPNCTLPS